MTVLANKGVSSHGEYFRSRVQELILNNVQFIGENEVQKNFCIAKFFYVFNKFTSLERINMVAIQNSPHAFKCLATSSDKGYTQSLKHLKMEACVLKEEHAGGWVVT